MPGTTWVTILTLFIIWIAIYFHSYSAVLKNPIFTHLISLITGYLIAPIIKNIIFQRPKPKQDVQKKGKGDNSVYGLDHARLNVSLPPSTMWMNMGYWENTADFPTACESLLKEVLKTAGLLKSNGSPIAFPTTRTLALLDLGYGCGDQTAYLTNTLTKDCNPNPDEKSLATSGPSPLFKRYVGITLDQCQFRYASTSLAFKGVLNDSIVRLFCADAARPSTWSSDIAQAVKELSLQIPRSQASEHRWKENGVETWVLALDTLYHFSPSRQAILEYSHSELGASLMAFDLLIADNLSFIHRTLLSILACLMGCPSTTFMTERAYRAALVLAGYNEDNIQLRDISKDVFVPLAQFLREHEITLGFYGWGLGKLKAAEWLFRWWGNSKVVRGVIIVARR